MSDRWGILEDVNSHRLARLRTFSLGRSVAKVQNGWSARKVWACGLAASVLVVSGCSSAVTVDAAPDATNPDCARALVAMPDTLAGQDKRETTAQATAAWGDPATIILKCGARVKEPVQDPCVRVNDVDWTLRQDGGAKESSEPSESSSSTSGTSVDQGQSLDGTGTWTATSFGRSPAIQVTFDAAKVNSSTLLVDLQSAVNRIHQTKECTDVSDNLDLSKN